MMRTASFSTLIFVLLVIISKQGAGAINCNRTQSQIDSYQSLDAVVTYLQFGVKKQSDILDLYKCLNVTQRNPSVLITNGGDLIYGSGYAMRVSSVFIPFWNYIQVMYFRNLWGGKIIQKLSQGHRLLNVFYRTKQMQFAANVTNAPSIVDGADCILLDYRNDTTGAPSNRWLIHRIRDEIREVTWRGQKSAIYIGRANIFIGLSSSLFTDAWQKNGNFITAINFFLDFRSDNQDDIPSWALPFFD
jgi:hypothetical protein